MGLARLAAPVHSRSGLVGRIDRRLAVVGQSLAVAAHSLAAVGHSLARLVGRNPGLGPAGYNRPGRPVDRTAVADRIETFFWKVGIEVLSDELKNSLK